MLRHFLQNEEGETLAEYGLLVALIALLVIVLLKLLGSNIKTVYNSGTDTVVIS